MRRAALTMYDLPAMRPAVDAWWRGLRRAFGAEGIDGLPTDLTRPSDLRALLTSPDLVLAQTCGYPLTHALAGRVTLLATPAYAAPGCDGPAYVSRLVVAADSRVGALADLRGRVAAVNGWDSHSGMNALRHAVAPLAEDGRFFADVVVSGSHARSIAMVAAGDADIAAIDGVTHALIERHDPALLAGVRGIGQTAAAPALPYVTRGAATPDVVRRLRAGLARAVADPSLADARADLLIADVVVLDLAAYDRIVEIEAAAANSGYPCLS